MNKNVKYNDVFEQEWALYMKENPDWNDFGADPNSIYYDLINWYEEQHQLANPDYYTYPAQQFASYVCLKYLENNDKQNLSPKFKVGALIEYRGMRYEIIDVLVGERNYRYEVRCIEPKFWVDDHIDDVVTGIGMAGEEKMKLIEADKSSNWTEKDDVMLKDIISILKDSGYVAILRDPYINWVNSLKERLKKD